METMVITIEIAQHAKTGLMMAFSTELKGLLVHGKSFEEIEERTPSAIITLLAAQGCEVIKVEKIEDDGISESGYIRSLMKFNAAMGANCDTPRVQG